MKKETFSNEIASGMDALIKNADFMKVFSSGVSLTKKASDDKHADCVCCGKKRANWDESQGVCKCSSSGCSPMDGCKEGCSCGCVAKKEASATETNLIKQAFNTLLQASDELESAGLGGFSAQALLLANHLLTVEAKKKDPKMKEKMEKLRQMKEKQKAKEEKDKNMAKERAMKEKTKAQKEKERALKDRNDARDKAMKMKEKERAAKEKAKGK